MYILIHKNKSTINVHIKYNQNLMFDLKKEEQMKTVCLEKSLFLKISSELAESYTSYGDVIDM